ncbi:PEP-CTERM sorting domain-containing protein [Tsuneonella sp. HG249]
MNIPVALMLLASADPALAAANTVAEPSGMALFALGVVGVIVGRQASRRKRD